MKILLPIKEEYIERILNGEKKYEYRHCLAQKKIDTIILYATAPKCVVVGEVSVIGRIEKPPTVLWEETKKYAGITRKKYREYFSGKKNAKAYVLGKPIRYSREMPLEEFGLTHAPQSFIYLTECPFCSKAITKSTKAHCLTTANSEEHIIPLSLGNDHLTLPRGMVCDECNNYFARKIEKDFLSKKAIELLRSYHAVPSRKDKVPAFDIMIGKEKTQLKIDHNNKCCSIDVSDFSNDLVDQFMNGKIKILLSEGISLEELKNDYSTSRFLVKVFLEVYLLYALEYYKERPRSFIFDKKMGELVSYVRRGNKKETIYDYSVVLRKEVTPFSLDDFVASASLDYDTENTITGMTLNLFELEFKLHI